MSGDNKNKCSTSLAVYSVLLGLYPRLYLRDHKSELLQNFEDFEHTLPSKIGLWLFIGRDLVVSLPPHIFRTLWGQTSIVILILSALLAYAGRHNASHQFAIQRFCVGYILGWFAGWHGKQWQTALLSYVPSIARSLPMQAAMVGGMLLLVNIAEGRSQSHVMLVACYGFLLAWFAGWIGNGRRRSVGTGGEPPNSTR